MIRFRKLLNATNSLLVLALLLTFIVSALVAQDAGVGVAVPGAWTLVATTGPTARAGLGMAFDPGRHRTVLFGGSDLSSNRFGDTWQWDGTAWLQVSSTGPSGRWGPGVAFDSAKHRTLVFGGTGTASDQFQENNDTWAWEGTTWTQIMLSHLPAARNSAGMAYDKGRDQVVLFGGGITFTCDPLRDTWELGSSGWIQRNPVTQPTRRNSPSMVYDTSRGRSVLFGGISSACGGHALGDTWEWDGGSWTQAATTGPDARYGENMAYDNARHRVVLFGGGAGSSIFGDTWEWDGVSWTKVASTGPSPRAYAGAAYDGVSRTVVLFGGLDNSSTLFADTWEWAGPIYACSGRTPGDLNCDRVVDGDDLAILRARMKIPVQGPGDPRDINHDGRITAEDAQELVGLGTKGGL